jgi:two-component system, cell cycle sensor histidine kinase and response regulator CckA
VVALVLLNQNDLLAPWASKAAAQASLVLVLCLVIVILTRLVLKHLDRLKLAQDTVSDQQVQLGIKAAQIDAANDAILQIDLEGNLVNFNQALCRITGYDASELAGRRLHDLEPPGHAELIIPNLEIIRQCQEATFESAYLAKDGTVIPIEVHARIVESEGRVLVLSITRDITQRKRADQRESARRDILEQIANGAGLPEVLAQIVSFVEQELPAALCSVLLADESGSRLRHAAAASLPEAYNQAVDGISIALGICCCGTAAFLHQRVVVEKIEGHPYWKDFSMLAHTAGLEACWSEPVLSSEGDLLGTVAVYHRKTHAPGSEELRLVASASHLASIAIERVRNEQSRKTLEEHLRQIQKIEAVGQLAAGIAHDFNNLLTPIFVYSDMIRRSFSDGDPELKQIDAVILAAQKASELTLRLLSFGRKQMLCIDVLDLNEIISSFAGIMRTTVKESVSFELRLTPGKARLRGDRGQMEQVLLNLTVNAQDAIAGSGAIKVETGHLILDEEYARVHPGVKPGPYVLLAFSDSGCGMDEETLRHIYEPFFTTKEVGRGTGLGLATIYSIIKQHEGHIEVRSRPGEGTTFKIFLPMSQGSAGNPLLEGPGRAARHATGRGMSILLVEDDSMIREMAKELLEENGYRVLVAATPLEALGLAGRLEGVLDLLVSDVVMPQMNGPELHERLLEEHPRLPVLFISGYAGNVVLHKETLEMETSFLIKPFTLEQFLGRIQEILAGPA